VVENGFGSQVWDGLGRLELRSYFRFSWSGSLEIYLYGWQIFKSHIRFKPGQSSKIRFWDDVWCGDSLLKVTFPGLFNIANYKEVSIADNVEQANGAIQWNIQFTWLIQDWEVEVLASFYRRLYSCKLREDGKISCGGCLRARGVSRLSLSIEPSRPMSPFLFLGRVFGDQRLPRERHFLCGRPCTTRSSPWIILGGGA
jgi:hypothetical protein